MRIKEDNNYFDDITLGIESYTRTTIAVMNEEFKEWLKSEGLFLEKGPIKKKDSGMSAGSYDKWVLETISNLKSNYNRFDRHIRTQVAQDQAWLKKYSKLITDNGRFPVSPKLCLKSAPNYFLAFRRITMNIGSKMAGIDLNKIDPSNVPEANMWLKKYLIPDYPGKVEFPEYCKAYFYGKDKQMDYSVEEMTQLVQVAFMYCSQFLGKTVSVRNDINTFVAFINKSIDGIVKNTTNTMINSLQNNKQGQQAAIGANQMASTNPMANAIGQQQQQQVNADTNMLLFYADYLPEFLNEEDQQNVANTVAQANGNNIESKVQQSATSLFYKRKQASVEVIRDCINARNTVISLMYRDFIYVLRNHVAMHKGQAAGNAGQQQGGQQQ